MIYSTKSVRLAATRLTRGPASQPGFMSWGKGIKFVNSLTEEMKGLLISYSQRFSPTFLTALDASETEGERFLIFKAIFNSAFG